MRFRKLLTACVALSLLAGVSATAGTTVTKDGDVATGITDLVIGSNTYDVAFTCNTTTLDHWGNPPTFDFTTAEDAYNAVVAIVGALNADGTALGAGCGTGSSEFSPYIFRLGWMLAEDVRIPVPLFDDIYVDILMTQEAVTGDTSSPGVWAPAGTGPEDFDQFPWGDDSVSPLFTLVSGDGISNSAPTADAGGPYQGKAGDPIRFDGSGSSDVDGDALTYEWNLGDGTFSGGETPSHAYTEGGFYNVILTVTDDDDASSSDSTLVEVGTTSVPPIADAGGPYAGVVGKAIAMSGLGSTDADGSISSYSWDFGDGIQGNSPEVQKIYYAPGSYTVTLTVFDNTGESDTGIATALIGNGDQAPTADAGGPYVDGVGFTVNFNGSGSTDPEGGGLTYAWNFGDGSPVDISGPNTSHVYASVGSYTATLTVTDVGGNVDSSNASVLIFENAPTVTRKDIIGLPDVNGNSSADLAVLYKAVDLTSTVAIIDGSTGDAINTLTYGTDPVTAIAAVERDGLPPSVAAMRYITSSGATQVRISEAASGTLVSDLFLGSDYRGVDMTVLPDSDGNGADEVVTYRIDAAEKAIVSVQDSVSKAVLHNYNHGAGAEPLEVDAMPDLNSDGTGEIALLQRVRADGKIRVRVLDPEANAILSDVSYGNVFSAIAMAIVPGPTPADTGIGLLGVRDSDVVGRLLIKNALANTNISTKQWSATEYTPVDLDTVSDNDADGYADVSMFEETEAGEARVRIFSADTGAQLINFPLQNIAGAIAAAAVDDVNGNGSSEVAGLGRGGTQFAVHAKDSDDKTLVFSTEVP